MMNCMIEKKVVSYISYRPAADSTARQAMAGCVRRDQLADTIVTGALWHAAVGLAKCIALGVDGTEAYTTVA